MPTNNTSTLENGAEPDRKTRLMLDRVERQLKLERDKNNKPQYSVRDWDVQHLINHLRNLEAVCDGQEEAITRLQRSTPATTPQTDRLEDQVAQLEAEVARLRKELALAQRSDSGGEPVGRVRVRRDWASIKKEWQEEQAENKNKG